MRHAYFPHDMVILANNAGLPNRHGGLCWGPHLSRQLLALGHDVRLIPAQFVMPFRKSHKNDFRDAEAIAEAVLCPTTRFVPTKMVAQLDL